MTNSKGGRNPTHTDIETLTRALAGGNAEQLEKAGEKCRILLASSPGDAALLHLLGNIEFQLGHVDLASKAYQDALSTSPNDAQILNDLGVVLRNKGSLEEAANCFTRAIIARPDYPLPLNNLGFMHFSSGNIDAAEELYRRALALKPEYPDALNNLGILLYNRGAIVESIALIRKALALQPKHPNALNNLGKILHDQGSFEESVDCLKRALTLRPKHSDALNNLGNALRAMGKLPEAIESYEQAIMLKDSYPEYHTNLAMALLAAGRFGLGWREYEWRWKTAQLARARRETEKPRWQGEAAQGRTLLIRAEQGFGDTLQFCRYAPIAVGYDMHVVLEVQPALFRLMGSLKGVEVVAQGEPLPDFDLQCPMMSLPPAFNTRLETIPADVPYLAANGADVDKWQSRLSDTGASMMKVGLAWAGKSRIQSPDLIAADRRRSMAPGLIAPFLNVAGVCFYSLQKGGPAAPGEFGLTDLMEECNDFADTAALMTNLDLVISVDTAVAHLAGALGKPVWLLNRFDTCWRWLQTREESPWYPTLRIFRQPAPGDWKSVVLRVTAELQKVVMKR